jgi:hypothetical protein
MSTALALLLLAIVAGIAGRWWGLAVPPCLALAWWLVGYLHGTFVFDRHGSEAAGHAPLFFAIFMALVGMMAVALGASLRAVWSERRRRRLA